MTIVKPAFLLSFFFHICFIGSPMFAQSTAKEKQDTTTVPGLAGQALTNLFVNINHQDVARFQMASLVNIARSNVNGLQISGLVNVGRGGLKGAQVTGLSNTVAQESRGTQLAGISNHVGGKLTGFQAAGILNYAGGTQKGIQISGLANISKGDVNGAQLASLYNQGKTVNYLQMSGGINVADTLKGAQIGLINRSTHQQGFQLGLINLSDTISGRSLGLITLSKTGGHYAIEAYSTSSFFANVSMQIGTKRLYTIFSGGINDQNDVEAFTTAIGFGSVSSGSKWLQVRQELNSGWVRAKRESVNTDMSLFKYDLLLQLSLLPNTRVFAGPSASFLISWTNDTDEVVESIAPYNHADGSFGRKPWEAWVGFRAGLQFGLWH